MLEVKGIMVSDNQRLQDVKEITVPNNQRLKEKTVERCCLVSMNDASG